jgi:hypothetical protein
MALDKTNNITLTGLDWSNKLREVSLDMNLWVKITQWHGDQDSALRWVQLQIKLFSSRHPESEGLSHIISSIALVEMKGPRITGAAAAKGLHNVASPNVLRGNL